MTDNAAGMTVGAGYYFKFGMSIPLAKVPFLRHFGGDRGAPGTGAAAGIEAAPGIEAAAGAEDRGRDRSDGRGGGNAGGRGDDVVKASWGRSCLLLELKAVCCWD